MRPVLRSLRLLPSGSDRVDKAAVRRRSPAATISVLPGQGASLFKDIQTSLISTNRIDSVSGNFDRKGATMRGWHYEYIINFARQHVLRRAA